MAVYRIAVFASGGGSNLQALIDRIRSGELPVEIAFVLSNNSKSGALEKARAFGAPAYHVSAQSEGGEGKAVARMLALLDAHKADLLVLAGYMKPVPLEVLARMRNRVVNIHPALLPAFGGQGYYGHKVHEGVLARGCQFTGLTIHMVNERYDEGQILLQRMVPVPPGSTADEVGALVLKLEHAWYWQVIRAFATGAIRPLPGDDPSRAADVSAFLAALPPGP
ncbi:MAG: phosphoribosylglycinamide formyltransferase [Fibrobacteres bacterium]|nr:phosphoribosylglycinamide formyltransferase [Fibrobacterota bacterium]